MPMEKFNLEVLWNDYLKKNRLDPKRMSSVHYRQIKRAFFGGGGTIFLALAVDMPALSDEKSSEAMDLLLQQFKNFLENEIESPKSRIHK
jgi:hypothetical protein